MMLGPRSRAPACSFAMRVSKISEASINDGVAFGVDVRARGCVAGRIAIEEEGEDERNEMGWDGWYTCRNHAEGAAACNCVV